MCESFEQQAECTANSLDIAKRLIEQHIDDVYEILGGDTYTVLDSVISILNSTTNNLRKRGGEKCAIN
jgi:hypothetical protein